MNESIIQFSRTLLSVARSELEVEKVKSRDGKSWQSLCMAQHYQMFRLYRRPGLKADEHVHLDRATSGNHIIVAHHNQVKVRFG